MPVLRFWPSLRAGHGRPFRKKEKRPAGQSVSGNERPPLGDETRSSSSEKFFSARGSGRPGTRLRGSFAFPLRGGRSGNRQNHPFGGKASFPDPERQSAARSDCGHHLYRKGGRRAQNPPARSP